MVNFSYRLGDGEGYIVKMKPKLVKKMIYASHSDRDDHDAQTNYCWPLTAFLLLMLFLFHWIVLWVSPPCMWAAWQPMRRRESKAESTLSSMYVRYLEDSSVAAASYE